MDRLKKLFVTVKKLLAVAKSNAEGLVAITAFLAFSAGWWLAWRPLGLIIPGGIVFVSLALKHLRGGG